jgi:hypothetical protein
VRATPDAPPGVHPTGRAGLQRSGRGAPERRRSRRHCTRARARFDRGRVPQRPDTGIYGVGTGWEGPLHFLDRYLRGDLPDAPAAEWFTFDEAHELELWGAVLAHRPADQREAVRDRFVENGVSAEQVRAVLADAGDALYAGASSGRRDWAEVFGGPLAGALLAAEVSALTAHLTSRASAVRAVAVDALLDDLSAVTVAARLGISRQKVYDLTRGSLTGPYLDAVPWRQP